MAARQQSDGLPLPNLVAVNASAVHGNSAQHLLLDDYFFFVAAAGAGAGATPPHGSYFSLGVGTRSKAAL